MAMLAAISATANVDASPAGVQQKRARISDVAGFCKAQNTIDFPDRAFFGRAYRDGRLPAQVSRIDGASKWRCLDGKVLVCQDSADGDWCGTKDPSRIPSKVLRAECAATPNASSLSFAVSHFSAHDWRCAGRRPVIARSYPLDRRGFFTASWVPYVAGRKVTFGDGIR